ncbi:hypothetical protein JZ751_003510 [Albula glossodonta]|uniref:Dermatopontin n=1 Tax=Albula glossodonta TaxID=121402 RepID=A0A8T2MV94_9TELE|nr:hypothetical protein JZ751_003510 [Albula glossodonta]
MQNVRILLFLVAGLHAVAQAEYHNSYDDPLTFTCNQEDSISMVTSKHSNSHEDRLYGFSCKKTFDSLAQCFWTNYVNCFDERFTFYCPPNHVISGMASYHDNGREDRRWKYYCCRVNNYCNSNCRWTTYVNNFDDYFTWNVPSQNYLVGAESYHDNKREDRRWRFYYCTRNTC